MTDIFTCLSPGHTCILHVASDPLLTHGRCARPALHTLQRPQTQSPSHRCSAYVHYQAMRRHIMLNLFVILASPGSAPTLAGRKTLTVFAECLPSTSFFVMSFTSDWDTFLSYWEYARDSWACSLTVLSFLFFKFN